ncbi:hypothetical protein ACWDBW_13570 [Streptomyces sp. NPDC001107]
MWSIATTARGRLKAHASPEQGFRAAFGDFDHDGCVDMPVTYTAPPKGDDPVDSASLHEVRWGPLGRHTTGDGAFETCQGPKLGHDLVVPDESLLRWGQEFAEQKDGWDDLGGCPASS